MSANISKMSKCIMLGIFGNIIMTSIMKYGDPYRYHFCPAKAKGSTYK